MNKLVSTAAGMAAAAWLLAGAAAAQTPEKFAFALNWFAVGDHAAYWVALEKGYFAQRGLDGQPPALRPWFASGAFLFPRESAVDAPKRGSRP